MQVLDSLMGLGPIRSTIVSDLHLRESDVHASLSGLSGHTATPSPCLLAAVGADKAGALAIMRRGVVADVITAVPNLGAHGAWTLHYRPAAGPASQAHPEAAGLSPEGQTAEGAAGGTLDGAAGGGGSGTATVKQDGEGAAGDTVMDEDAAAAAPAAAGVAAGAAAAGGSGGDAAGGGVAVGAAGDRLSDSHHAFLLLSCGGSQTMVLDARGQNLAEVTDDVSDALVYACRACDVGRVGILGARKSAWGLTRPSVCLCGST